MAYIQHFLQFLFLCNISKLLHPFSAYHTCYTYDNERYAEQLTHIERQRGLECFLYLLGVLYEETRYEDVGKAKPEEESRTNTLGLASIQSPTYEEQQCVGYSLVELSWMAWHAVNLLEDKGPRHISNLAYYLRVHKVAQSDKACRNRCGNGNIVEYLPYVHFGTANVQP